MFQGREAPMTEGYCSTGRQFSFCTGDYVNYQSGNF